jgi:hypothetical protein
MYLSPNYMRKKSIDFKKAKTSKEEALNKLENNIVCIELLIPIEEVSYWIQAPTYSTHSAGYLIQNETNERELKLDCHDALSPCRLPS